MPFSASAGRIALAALGLSLGAGQLAAPPAAAAPPVAKAAVTTAAAAKTTKAAAQVSGADIVAEAKKHQGKAYRFGASGPHTFDCSGYTMYVYRKVAGKTLPHKAHLQQKAGTRVSKSAAKVGDLVVIRSGSRGTHAGIYAGDGYMWNSPRSGKTVSKQKIWSSNYVVQRLI
jgi:cell wall-associated NlpC family hydrolase